MKKNITMKKLPKSKSRYGYTKKEIEDICHKLSINTEKFWVAFGINTCALIAGEPRYYLCDVERALHLLGNKLGKYHMWD